MAVIPNNRGLPELIQRLAELEAAVIASLEDLAKELALNAKAFAERTILEKGVGQYSSTLYPAWWLMGKELNQDGKHYIEGKIISKEGGNWKGLRQKQGLNIEFVDLHYSNKMFAGMGIKEVEKRGTWFYGVLGNNSKEGQDKMNWNKERYGNFIEIGLGDDGRAFLSQLAKNRIIQTMRNFNL